MKIYFLEAFLGGFFGEVLAAGFASLLIEDLILDALFLWITFFLTARSARAYTFWIFVKVLLFLAALIAFSRLAKIAVLISFLFSDERKARFAVFVTGTRLV